MKKILISVFLLFFLFTAVSFNLTAEEKSAWEDSESGDYLIYQDLSWKEQTWVGFLYYNGNTIGSFLYTSNGKVFAKVLFSGEILDGDFVITGQNNISGINTDPAYTYAVNYLMGILPKLYSWKTQKLTESLVIKTGSKIVNEEQFGGESEIKFHSYIPLFHIKEILDSNKEKAFELVEMGRVKDEKTFFEFSPLEEIKPLESKFVLNPKAKKETRTVDGVKLLLDSQWKQIADNTFLMGNEAFLNVNTVDLKLVPDISGKEIDFLIRYFSSSGEVSKVLSKNTDINGTKQKFKIINSVYDLESKSIKHDIKLIIKKENSKYTVVSLTVDKSSYQKYKDYFDGLF
ncbi:hypothetical protein [Treponema putidum]|uniref:Uncharacterized protein n=1 Tax=Treponema putidum TaxID=221027 RepID=A0AAE9MTL7_9SPIR|nr:hypothetical protein [Treponema putidum]AIN94095.1 hypothetical protein JO40_08260 [Treponema putidum]TWI77063.1 hypothetical protein JM98_01628 [Treponema putidum]UTY28042.1 hypothetical protein E4N76_02905 [Treponema putidum]UTY30530.1 hypothetical protein E4N75_02440 [Treponema putidum]UTY32948.1 hypothetical protein E4N74_02210 [Treponema putidum]